MPAVASAENGSCRVCTDCSDSMQAVKDRTGLEDLVALLRREVLLSAAARLGCNKVLSMPLLCKPSCKVKLQA